MKRSQVKRLPVGSSSGDIVPNTAETRPSHSAAKPAAAASPKHRGKKSKGLRPPRQLPHRERNPELTRQQILLAASKEFSEFGFGAARINRIALRAKANKRLLYHYFGDKEALYSAVLEAAYNDIRSGEQQLDLDKHEPEQAMERLIRFTFRHFVEKPWFVRLLATENLHNARFLKQLPSVTKLHPPLVELIRRFIQRGAVKGVFRADVDPVHLYITIAALGYFYFSNIHTLSTIFERDLTTPSMMEDRETHAVDVVLSYLKANASTERPKAR